MLLVRYSLSRACLHILALLAFVVSVGSGLRLAQDAQWFSALSAYLPLQALALEGDVYSQHQYAAFAWLALAVVYVGLMLAKATQSRRKKLPKSIVLMLLTLTLSLVSGLLLFLLPLLWPSFIAPAALIVGHSLCAMLSLALVLWHTFDQLWLQRSRLLASSFVPKKIQRQCWLMVSITAAITVSLWALFDSSRPLLVGKIPALSSLEIDGQLDDVYWQSRPWLEVQAGQGNQYFDSVPIAIKALHNDKTLFIAVRWRDTEANYDHLPLVKTSSGWQVLSDGYGHDDERRYYEDKFALMWSSLGGIAGAASIHLGPKPLPGHPRSRSERGFHYTLDNSIRDIWHWKALRGVEMGVLDDNYFSTPEKPCEFCPRYLAGYQTDPSESGGYSANWQWFYPDQVTPLRLPNYAFDEQRIALGDKITAMPWRRTKTYKSERDHYPVGSQLPSVLHSDVLEGDRGHVRARAHWHNGFWTLEMARALDTGSEFDLPIEDGVYLWLASFNHAQTRHSYHLSPLKVVLQKRLPSYLQSRQTQQYVQTYSQASPQAFSPKQETL